MSKWATITTPGRFFRITTYDKRTRIMHAQKNEVADLQATIDAYSKSNQIGFLVGAFELLRDGHYVTREADTSPFVVEPLSARLFLEKMTPEAKAAGLYIIDAPIAIVHPPLTRDWLNSIADNLIHRHYPLGKQMTIDRRGSPEDKAEMYAYIDAVLKVANDFEGKPDEPLPWPDPPSSRVGKESGKVPNGDFNGSSAERTK